MTPAEYSASLANSQQQTTGINVRHGDKNIGGGKAANQLMLAIVAAGVVIAIVYLVRK